MFYTPGNRDSDYWDLYRLDGDTATLIWTAPQYQAIACLFYLASTEQLYVLTYDTWAEDATYLYASTPGETPTLVTSWAFSLPVQACQFGSYVYLYSAYSDLYGIYGGAVWKLDPADWSASVTFDSEGQAANYAIYGGIGSDGIKMYYSDGSNVYSSSDGATWTLMVGNDGVNIPSMGGFRSCEALSRMYYFTNWWFSFNPGDEINMLVADTMTTRLTVNPYGSGHDAVGIGGIAYGWNGTTPSGPVAVESANSVGVFSQAWWKGVSDTWDLGGYVDGDIASYALAQPHGLTSTGGVVYALLQTGVGVSLWQLVDDTWSQVLNHEGVTAEWSTMTVVHPTIKCHEV